jgi:signal transduction histidine kinase
MLFLSDRLGWHWWVFVGAVTAFWPLSYILRLTGWYVPLALLSIQNLIFCIIWGCYYYGGIGSPILPWFITVPLLAFFYLPSRKTRIVVSVLIMVNLAAFYCIYTSFGFPSMITGGGLVALGLVSTVCAGVYMSMMALYYANIVSTQSELEQEIHRHLETMRQLHHATEQVERATRAKSDFLAKMSHELRNPLNAIIGYTELLLEDSVCGKQTSADLKSIISAAYKLLELVNDLLDLSKLEAGKMELCIEQFSIADLIDQLVKTWQPRISERGVALLVEWQCEKGEINGDLMKLRQAMTNLLSNAAKYTQKGQIVVTIATEADMLVISVRDTGVGISAEQIGGLFETFGDRSYETASNYGQDAGLGLPLTDRLCKLMGGDLAVQSKLGHGSTFIIKVPLVANAQTDAGTGAEFDDAVVACAA